MDTGTLTVQDSVFSDNSASYCGGGINNGGDLTVLSSTFTNDTRELVRRRYQRRRTVYCRQQYFCRQYRNGNKRRWCPIQQYYGHDGNQQHSLRE